MMELVEHAGEWELTRNIADQLPAEERRWFPKAVQALVEAEVPFLLAGGYGLYHYTGFWRGTKDLDVLVLPEYREQAIDTVCHAGFHDMFREEAYDRDWIFRAKRGDVIVDLIWQLANKEDDVDQTWFDRAVAAEFMGIPVRVVSAADLCWMKLFVFQRKRCDWPDIINILRGTRGHLDWTHLLHEVGPHWRLLSSLVELYDWVCPADREFIPAPFRRRLEDLRRRNADATHECHHDLFDSRPWLTDAGAGYVGDSAARPRTRARRKAVARGE